jgi:hypothetical protein
MEYFFLSFDYCFSLFIVYFHLFFQVFFLINPLAILFLNLYSPHLFIILNFLSLHFQTSLSIKFFFQLLYFFHFQFIRFIILIDQFHLSTLHFINHSNYI